MGHCYDTHLKNGKVSLLHIPKAAVLHKDDILSRYSGGDDKGDGDGDRGEEEAAVVLEVIISHKHRTLMEGDNLCDCLFILASYNTLNTQDAEAPVISIVKL